MQLTRTSFSRTKLSRLASALLLTLAVQACSDSSVVAPSNFDTGAASLNAVPGVADFLAPLGSGTAVPSTFDAGAADGVVICTWISNACAGSPVAQFAVTPSAGVLPLVVNTAAGRYEATLNLNNTAFLTRKTYRIATMKGATVLSTVLVDIIRGRWALTRFDGTLAPLVAATNLPIQFHIGLPSIKVNEVESSGGTPGDWVELTNTGSTTVDISGYTIKDDNDTHIYTIANGTTIAPGQNIAFDVEVNYGLGAADMARVFTAKGVLLDSYAWTSHAVTTYGRCPNGTGAFTTMTTTTKGAANDCSVPNIVKINEIESSGGTPGDWIELTNIGTVPVDISGYVLKDNDNTHAFTIATGTIIQPGAFLVMDVETSYGLGGADDARLFNASGALMDSYSWAAHAATTYGRCPDGTGVFTTTTTVTRGAANDCSTPNNIRINEVESNGGSPGDWVELTNIGTSTVDVSGYVIKDDNDTHVYTIAAGTTIAAGGYLALDVETAYGLGAADQARLFTPAGVLLETYAWTAHATITYGRCPNGTGAFGQTTVSTKGAANNCGGTQPPTGPVTETWPGTNTVAVVDATGTFSSNASGLMYEAGANNGADVLWVAQNGIGSIHRMLFNGSIWTRDQNNGWGAGKKTHYTDGTGEPDTEDLTFTTGSAAGMYIVSERNNQNNGVSRPSILRYDLTAAGSATDLTATNEWVLTADLPVVAANSGLEAITWIPDNILTSQGFYDNSKSKVYNPADYANHAGGLFFVGLEGNGMVYVYALDHATSTFTRITSFTTGFPSGVMALSFDRELGQLWATCDDTCHGLSDIFVIDQTPGSPTLGQFKLTHILARATNLPDVNNEGFTFAPQAACVGGFKPAFWSDDNSTGGNSIRMAAIPCTKFP